MLNKDNNKEIVEQLDFYYNTVKDFNVLIRTKSRLTRSEFDVELKRIYKRFKLSLPIQQRLELKQIE